LFSRNSLSQVSLDDAAASTEVVLLSALFRSMIQNDEYLWDQIEGGHAMLSAYPTKQNLDCGSDLDGSDDNNDFSNDSFDDSDI
jgi:hypothetical protein